MEVLVFFPGGSSGNEFWEILHIDESGNISDTNSGEGMRFMSLYNYNGEYFILSKIIDYNDKEVFGWELYTLDKNGKSYKADIWLEKIGSKVVFSDKYGKSDNYGLGEWMLNSFIDRYKRYDDEAIGSKVIPGNEILELFNGTTKQRIDFSEIYYKTSQDLCCIVPYTYKDKNYLVFLLDGYGNYIIKLVEINGTVPEVLQEWLVSVENRILIQVSENNESRIAG
jgi:hypothetical protein